SSPGGRLASSPRQRFVTKARYHRHKARNSNAVASRRSRVAAIIHSIYARVIYFSSSCSAGLKQLARAGQIARGKSFLFVFPKLQRGESSQCVCPKLWDSSRFSPFF